MSDPFRQFFLDTVQNLVQKKPCIESLYKLLSIVSPDLTFHHLISTLSSKNSHINSTTDPTVKAFKLIKLRIHPDKHPSDPRVTQLFQDVQNFYDACSSCSVVSSGATKGSSVSDNLNSRKRPRTTLGEIAVKYPEMYNVITNSPHVSLQNPHPPQQSSDRNISITTQTLPVVLAYKCINARGALAHGKKITHGFSWRDVERRNSQNFEGGVRGIFDMHGGTKELRSVYEVKEELVSHGPVISVSFHLMEQYMRQVDTSYESHNKTRDCVDHAIYGNAFLKENVGMLQELLIVGWELSSFGESWLIQPLTCTSSENTLSPNYIPIGFNQFDINDLCLAPKSSFENLPWQPGPYFDTDFRDAPEWRKWTQMDLPLSSSEFQTLANCFAENGLIHAASTGKLFVIRDRKKFAHSESYCLKEVRWDENAKEWVATVHLIPS